jgi:hypothetical protein
MGGYHWYRVITASLSVIGGHKERKLNRKAPTFSDIAG